MGAGQLWLGCMFMGQCAQGVDQLAHQGKDHLVATIPQHQGIGQIVDVFRGAREMDELHLRSQLRMALNLFLEEILHSLHVVIGGGFDLLDALGVCQRKILGYGVQKGSAGVAQWRRFRDLRRGGQSLQPANFDNDAIADQGEFAEIGAQGVGLVAVAAVDRRDRSQAVQGKCCHVLVLPIGWLIRSLARRQSASVHGDQPAPYVGHAVANAFFIYKQMPAAAAQLLPQQS